MARVLRRKSGPVRPVGTRNTVRGVRATPVTPPSPQKAPEPSLAPKKVCGGCTIRLATHEYRAKNSTDINIGDGRWNPVCRLCGGILRANPGTNVYGAVREYEWRCIRPGKRNPHPLDQSELMEWVRKRIVESIQVAEDKAIVFGTGTWEKNHVAILAEERIAMQVHKPKSFVNITVTP